MVNMQSGHTEYSMIRHLGQGTYGEVYEARVESTDVDAAKAQGYDQVLQIGTLVAIKKIKTSKMKPVEIDLARKLCS